MTEEEARLRGLIEKMDVELAARGERIRVLEEELTQLRFKRKHFGNSRNRIRRKKTPHQVPTVI